MSELCRKWRPEAACRLKCTFGPAATGPRFRGAVAEVGAVDEGAFRVHESPLGVSCEDRSRAPFCMDVQGLIPS